MGLFSFLGDAIKPVTSLVDSLHTSGEEKDILRNELVKLENAMASKVLDYETKLAEMQANVIMAEANGKSWLQRSWRPITMLTFLSLIVGHYLGLLAFPIADQMWGLLKIGIGGYIGGRTLEKTAESVPKIVAAIKRKVTNG